VLHPLVQFDEEVGLRAVDHAARVELPAQRLYLGAIGLPVRQDGLFDFSQAQLDAFYPSTYYISLVILKPSFSIRVNQPSIPFWPFRSKGK
jgi:hypothetical protein